MTEEEGSLDIVQEALESVRVESLPQSQAENITCSHDWEGIVAQQYECRGIIDTNYARIASIEEDMRLLREQMKNCWREGSRVGEAGTSMGMGGPNMGDAGHSMGEDEERHSMSHDDCTTAESGHAMGLEDPNMGQQGENFWTPQPVFGGYLEYNVHDGGNLAGVGTSSRSPAATPIRSYGHYTVQFASLDFGRLYKFVTVKRHKNESIRYFDCCLEIYLSKGKFMSFILTICLCEVVVVYIGL